MVTAQLFSWTRNVLHNKIGQLQCLDEFINPTGLPFVQYLCSRIIHGPFNDCCATNILKSNSTIEFIKFYLFSLK